MDANASNSSKPKTIYFSNYQDKIIMKTVIQPDGSFSKPEKFADGTSPFHHTQIIHFSKNNPGREFNYSIEGKTVLEKYDPPTDIGTIKSFDVTIVDGNGLTIEAIKTGNDVFEAAIEVVSATTTNKVAFFNTPTTVQKFNLKMNAHQLTVNNWIAEPAQVSVYNHSRKMVGSLQITTKVISRLDFNHTLSNGVYFIHLISALQRNSVGVVLK